MSLSILVTDDSRMSRRNAIKALPEELSPTITEAGNGREAIALLEQQKFDLLLLDLTMPEIDGIGVLEFLFQQQNPPAVIVVSADIQPQSQQMVLELGAKKFLKKPLNPDELAMTLFELGFL